MDNLEKVLACLERIAFQTQSGPLEFEAFKKDVLYDITVSGVGMKTWVAKSPLSDFMEDQKKRLK